MRYKGMSGFKIHDKFNQVNERFLSGYSEGGDDNSLFIQQADQQCHRKFVNWITCGKYCDDSNENLHRQAIQTLFFLHDKKDEKSNLIYFEEFSRDVYQDLLNQLEILIEKNYKKDQQLMEILDKAKNLPKDATHLNIYEAFQDNQFKILEPLQDLVNFRKKMADVFSLADKDNDKALYHIMDELDDIWEVVDIEIERIDDLDLQNEAKCWQMHTKEVMQGSFEPIKFHQIQKFAWEGKIKYEFDVEKIRNNLFKKRIRCHQFCYCICKYAREFLTSGRVKGKNPQTIHFSPIKSLTNLYGQFSHSLDLLTDGLLAWDMYWLSRNPNNHDVFADSYNICFIIIVMAMAGPYIIQYSSLMNAIHNKGFFKHNRFNQFSCLKRWFLRLAFTFFGLLIMPTIDILLKIESVLKFIAIPFYCRVGKNKISCTNKIHITYENFLETLFNLNPFELENFEKQKKYTQVLFEDSLMLTLQVLIFLSILHVPLFKDSTQKIKILDQDALVLSFITTINSMFFTWLSLAIESQGLKESQMEYIMLSMKAKQDWVPYGNKIMNLEIGQDIDYSMIEFKIPVLTDLTGYYKAFIYMFSQESLQKLTAQLDQAYATRKILLKQNQNTFQNRHERKQNEIRKFIPRLKFGFSLYQTSVHDFCNFIDRNHTRDNQFVWQYIDMNDIDWSKMIENSEKQNKFAKVADTDSGKSLLQVCIENENSEKKTWQLKPLMKLLLERDDVDLNVLDDKQEYTLLCYCYYNKKHQAFSLIQEIINHKLSDDDKKHFINLQNGKDKSTIYGTLFYTKGLKFYKDNGHRPGHHLKSLMHHFGTQINKNMPSIAVEGQRLQSPIFHYLKYKIQTKDKTLDQIFTEPLFQKYFGCTSHQPSDPIEIMQLFICSFDGAGRRKISESLYKLTKEVNKEEYLDNHFDKKNECGENFMHLVECRYAPPFWMEFLKNGDESKLKQSVIKLLKEKNNQGQTPLQQQLDGFKYNYTAIAKLFNQDLLEKGCFDNIEEEILEKFQKYFVTQFSAVEQGREQRNNNMIKAQKFFGLFSHEYETYKRMKMKFEVLHHSNIFDHYLRINQFEAQLENASQIQEFQDQTYKDLFQQKTYDLDVEIRNLDQGQKSIIYTAYANMLFEEENSQVRHVILETYLNGSIEISSALDFFSDMWVLYQLSRSTDTAWFTITLFTMICPYYTVYSSLMTFKINDIRKLKERGIGFGTLKNLLMILPLNLILMIFIDMLIMFPNALIYFVMFFIIYFQFGIDIFIWLEKKQDQLFMTLFGMSFMDVRGFKCQRTILQLQLESIPQIIFQSYLLWRIPQLEKSKEMKFTIKIDKHVIKISIAMACIHLVFELINLYLECRTAKTNFQEYMVASYSARQGWIPNKEEFYKQSQSIEENLSKKEQNLNHSYYILDQTSMLDKSLKEEGNLIEFDNLSRKFCGMGYTVEFQFSDNSMEYLNQIISDLPYQYDESKQKTIVLGQCIQNVKLMNIVQLLHLANNKIKVLFVNQILRDKIQKDEVFLKKIQKPQQYHTDKSEEYYLIDMVRMNYTQVVEIMIELDADLTVASKNPIEYQSLQHQPDDEKTKLFKIAYKLGSKDMLFILFRQKNKNSQKAINEQMREINIISQEIIQMQNGKLFKQPLLFLDPLRIISYDMLNKSIYNMQNVIQKYPDYLRQMWHTFFGAYVPFIDYQNNVGLVKVVEKVKKWVKEYDQFITICYDDGHLKKQVKLHSQFLCQFVMIRRAFFMEKSKNISDNFKKCIDLTEILQEISCNLDDIINLYKIFYGQLQQADVNIIKKCDRIVTHFGFDKQWSQYYHNSRMLLQNQTLTETILLEMGQNFKLGDNVLAIKELRITNNSQDIEASKLKFEFYQQHYYGWFDTFVSNAEFWQDHVDEDENLVQVIKFECTNYDLVNHYQFRLMNLVIKNQLKGGDSFKITTKDKDGKLIDCKVQLICYIKL